MISDIITRTFAAIISAIIAWHSFLFLIDEWNSGAMAFASVPAWLPESIIPIGFAIIALRYAFQVLVLISQSFREHGKQ